jgi:hypothetical protein
MYAFVGPEDADARRKKKNKAVGSDAVTFVAVRLQPDDALSVVRGKIARELGVRPEELCMWVTKDVSGCQDASDDFMARALRRRTSIDYRELLALHALHSGVRSAKAHNIDSKMLTREQAARVVADEIPVTTIAEAVGARFARSGVPMIMGAVPFTTRPIADPALVAADGSMRRGAYDVTQEDTLSLEDYCHINRHDEDTVVLEVATLADVVKHVGGGRAMLNGHVRKFFPLWPSEKHADDNNIKERGGGWRRDDRELSEVVRNAEKLNIGTRISTACSIQYVRLKVAPPADFMFQQGGLGDMLYELFAAFRATRAVPCIRHFDGARTTFKLNRASLSANESGGGIPATALQRWLRVQPRQGDPPYLQVYVAMPAPLEGAAPSFASVVLRHDLGMHVQCGFPRLTFAQTDRVSVVSAAVNRYVIGPLRGMLQRADVRARIREVDTRSFFEGEGGDEQPGCASAASSTELGRLTCMLNIRGGVRMPTQRELETMIRSMRSMFTVLGVVGGRLLIQYKRVGGFSKRERVPFVVRLMRDQPMEAVTRELVESFAMSKDEAVAQYQTILGTSDAASQQGAFNLSLRSDTVPLILVSAAGRLGFDITVLNIRRVEHMQRISWLLRMAVSAAGSGARLLGESMASRHQLSSSVTSWGAPSSKNKSNKDSKSNKDNNLQGDFGEADFDGVDVADELGRGSEEFDDDIDELIRDLRAEDESIHDVRKPATSPIADDNNVDVDDEDLPHAHLVKDLYRADAALYKYKGSIYSTKCAHNEGRQPIVITPEEQARIDKEFPGSYTDAFKHGSTPELAARNVYMCPKVWCPKSRVSLNAEQFKKLKGRCPYPDVDEEPIVFDNYKYFKGKERYPGFFPPGLHPGHLCMPCCFARPKRRYDVCLATPPKSTDEPAAAAAVAAAVAAVAGDQGIINDTRYILGDVAPLEVGRYGVLPPPLSAILDNKRCGNREAGSGQIVASTDCFVRRGVGLSRQGFLQCAVEVLGNDAIGSVIEFAHVVRSNLSPDVFVTLNDGHLCRSYMQGGDPDHVLSDHGQVERFKAWMAGCKTYVKRFKLQAVAAAVAAIASSPRSPSRQASSHSPELRREALVFSAMMRFLDELQDDSVVKTHHMLLDLVCRPLPWLNPKRANFLVFERNSTAATEDADVDDMRVYATCPAAGAKHTWRLSDPVVMLVRQGAVYEPVCRVTLRDRRGIIQTNTFHYDADRRVHSVVSQYMKRCSAPPGGADANDGIGTLLAAMTRAGHPAVMQVVDYAFRLVGFVTERKLFVPLSSSAPVLIGDVGSRMSCMYVSDIVALRPDIASPGAAESLLARIADLAGVPTLKVARRLAASKGRVAALETVGGRVVPIDMRRDDAAAAGYLEHLNMFAGAAHRDERVRLADTRLSHEKVVWAARTRVVRALRGDPAASRELLALRSPFHPFPPAKRRVLALALVRRFSEKDGKKVAEGHKVVDGHKRDVVVNIVTDALLYGMRPFSLQQAVPVDMTGAVLLYDIDVMSGAVDRLLAKRKSAFEITTKGVEGKDGWFDDADVAHSSSRSSATSLWRSAGVLKSKASRASNHPSARNKVPTSESRRRKKNMMVDVDVHSLIYLAHRMLHTDAVVPFKSMVDVLRDRIVSDARQDLPALRKALTHHPSLGNRSWSPAELADAVGKPGYRAGVYDIEVLAPFCDINVALIDSDATRGDATVPTRIIKGAVDPGAAHMLLRCHKDGRMDALLNDSGRNGGGPRLLFQAHIIDA